MRIGDDVRAQKQFGIEELQLVTGGSMGAQQTYEWTVRFPEKVRRGSHRGFREEHPHDFLYTDTLMVQIGFDEDMFFPVRDCKAEQEMIPNSELRVVESISGHLGLFNLEPSYIEQVDQHLGELLDSPA